MAKTLYVIGNGFDLAHELETKLCCFRCYLKYKDDDSRKFLEALSKYVPFDATWSNFEEALGKIDSNQIEEDTMDYAQSPSDENFKDSSWGDPAYEASRAVAFSSEIPKYLKEWINSIRIEGRYLFSFQSNALFLSFNYTNTLEIIYGISKDRICYIHGDSSTDDVLISGHNNKFLPKENVVEESDFANQIQQVNDVIKCYYNATRKETQIYMQEHKAFFEQLSSVETIEIIGHSFENTIDDDYFSYLKEKVSPNCKWEISCYSDSDRKNNDTFAQRIGLQNYKSYSLNPLFRITDER